MRVPRSARVEKVASRDASRPVLCALYLRVSEDGGGSLEATDSYSAVRVPVTLDEGDTEGFVTPEALKAARAANRRGDPWVGCNGSLETLEATHKRPELGQFPNLPGLWPEQASAGCRVGLNAKLLYELAQGLGSDQVEIRFVPNDDGSPNGLRPMVVLPMDGQGEGILMPVRCK